MTKMIKLIVGCLVALIVAMMLFTCSLFEKDKIIYPEAEIVGVQALSDTSVTVSIDVYSNSNAQSCRLSVSVDTLSDMYHSKYHLITTDCYLDPHYDKVIFGLKKGQLYYFRLTAGGTFALDGPNYSGYKQRGADYSYTIP